MTQRGSWRCALAGVMLWACLGSPLAFADVPPLIRYQGQATDKNGVPLLDGTNYTLTIRLYDAETGGKVLWDDTFTNVPITKGHFSVLLGQPKALTVDWTKPVWIALQIGTNDPELSPRQRITSVPTAIVADRLATPVTTSTITDDAKRLVPAGAVILWTGASCPAGYTRLVALDGKFLVGGASFDAAAGGSNTHTHGAGSYAGPSHAHVVNLALGSFNIFGGGIAVTQSSSVTTSSSGTGAVTGTSASADSRPEFATVVLCKDRKSTRLNSSHNVPSRMPSSA